MADITMCTQTLCPSASTCYRRTAKANEYWQSYAVFEYKITVNGVQCEHYLKNYTVSLNNQT